MAQYLSKEGADNLSSAIRAYIDSTHSTSLLKTQLGAANGVAALDEFGKVLQTQLPDYILGQVLFGGTIDGNGVATLTTLFKNRYNLSVATLDVDNLTAANYEGSYFIATANGVSGIAKTLDIVVGDWVISNGSEWTKIDNTDAVRTVLGLKGDIQASDLRNAMLGKSGNQGTNLALGDIWMGNGDGTVTTHRTSVFARSILASIAENTMFSKLWADRATNDGNGKNIANTYIPFAGGTFTGDVTHNANMILANSKVIAGKDTSGSNISLLSLNSSNQVIIGYGALNKYDSLIYGKNILLKSGNGVDALKIDENKNTTAFGNIHSMGGVSAKGVVDFGISGGGSTGGGTSYTLNIVPSTNKVYIQLKGGDGTSDTKDLAIFSTTQAGVVPKSPSASSILRGNGWGTLAFSELTGKPTTLSGYGITDAKIANGVITLGGSTITPIVSSNLKTLTFAVGAFSAGSYTPTTTKTINIPTTTSHISEDGNLYFTNARAQAAITGGASTIVTSNLTASRALISNSSGKVAVSDITSTELSYLDGVSSNIQTQLNAKFPTANFTKANIKSTLGISDWALASSKPSYSASDISNLSLSVDTAYDWDANDEIDSQSYGYSLTVGSKSFAMSAMTKTEVNAIISKYFA
jgi:hypothetical protein